MANEQLYIVYGTGNDTVGLVEKITSSIANQNGNILDLRQDVMHGLFIVNLLVDMSLSPISLEEFQSVVSTIAEETNLELSCKKYFPVSRDPDIKNLLLVLLGYDKPGIISSITKQLSQYTINIEFANMVAREGVFLMELLTDISNSTLPVTNLEKVLSEEMKKVNITTLFQESDVFNKKKRIIVFDITTSFIDGTMFNEIINQTSITQADIDALYSKDKIQESLQNAASLLDQLPFDVAHNINKSITISSSTIELIQTLKIMGYRIIIYSHAFSFFSDYLKKYLNIDYAYGCPIELDDDTKTFTNEVHKEFFNPSYKEKIIKMVMEKEGVQSGDVTIITDEHQQSPGLGIQFNMKEILHYYNQHILSKESLKGILGSFGIPIFIK